MSFRSTAVYLNDPKQIDKLFSPSYLEGAKASNLGMTRTGMASALDKGIAKGELDKVKRNMGKGYVTFKVTDGDKDTPLNIGGRLFYPRGKDGEFTIIDDDFLEKQLDLEKERRSYLEDILEKASISNEICDIVLSVPDCKALLGATMDGGGIITDADLKAVDATPAMIETYDPSSITYSRAISKFKQVVKARLPILSKMTPDSVENKTIG